MNQDYKIGLLCMCIFVSIAFLVALFKATVLTLAIGFIVFIVVCIFMSSGKGDRDYRD